jgi:hypothetical protein
MLRRRVTSVATRFRVWAAEAISIGPLAARNSASVVSKGAQVLSSGSSTLATCEPPQQRQASGVDQGPVYRQPGLSVMPGSRRRSQGEDGRNQRRCSNSKSRASKQHQRRPAPCQRYLASPHEGGVRVWLHRGKSNSGGAAPATAGKRSTTSTLSIWKASV